MSENNQEQPICCVCLKTSQTIAVTPCNHPDPLCETCYQKVTSCPMCRAPFERPTFDEFIIKEANQGILEAADAGHEDSVRLMLF